MTTTTDNHHHYPTNGGTTDTAVFNATTTTSEKGTNTTVATTGLPPLAESYVPLITVQQYLKAKETLLYIEYLLLPLALLLTLTNMIVFCQKRMRNATSIYVIAISQSQILYLLLSVSSHVINAAMTTAPGYAYLFYFFYVSIYGSAVIRRGGYWVMCLLSAERLYAVVRPLHIKEFLLVRFPALFTVVALVVTGLYHVQLILKYTIKRVATPSGGSRYSLIPSLVYLHNQDTINGLGAAGKIIFSYLPLLILTILNILTIVVLRRYNLEKRRELKHVTDDEAERQNRRERQMTLTIVTATACYVVLSLPLAVHSVLISLKADYNMRGRESSIYFMMEDLGYVSTLLSYATDFASFILLSSAYRDTCLRLLRKLRCRSYSEGGSRAALTSDPVTSKTEVA